MRGGNVGQTVASGSGQGGGTVASGNHVVRGIVFAALGGICWGFSGTCAQLMTSGFGVPVSWITCVRLLLGALIFLVACLFKNWRSLRAVLREDPDIILIGEMRDLDTIQTALTAAETGHFVLATLHTKSAADSIDRMVDVFPEGLQRQVRMQLSTTLVAVLSQQLLPRRDGMGRALACELMMVTPAIRNLIREGKTPQIAGSLATSASAGSVTMDNALIALARNRDITSQTAIDAAHDVDYVRKSVR